jgi:hypothetical protein
MFGARHISIAKKDYRVKSVGEKCPLKVDVCVCVCVCVVCVMCVAWVDIFCG